MPAEGCVQGDRPFIVVAAGPGPDVSDLLPRGASVVAADGGLERCLALGLAADLVIGDLDSVGADTLRAAEEAGVEVVRHPPRKDATDLELALDEALARGARHVVVVGSAGGRLDHVLASLVLLAHERYAPLEVDAHLGEATVHVVRGERALPGRPGELVTLLAVAGPARGVTTRGLEYPLADETLEPGSSRGVSNVFTEATAHVAVADGVLLALRPGGAA
jgi:thiamine pyrophosphokinase